MQNCCAIIIPEVAEMALNPIPQLNRNVESAWIWLILDLLDHDKPTLQVILLLM